MTISQDMSVSFINTTVSSVNATKSKALFSLEESGATAALATFGGFFVSNCVLDESLFYLQGSHLTVNMDSFTVAGLSYEQDNPTALEGLFHLNGLHTFAIQNTHLSVSSRSEIGNYFMRIAGISQLLMLNSTIKVLSSSFSPLSFIALTLPLPQSTATFSNCTFEGMRSFSEGGLLKASGSGTLYLSNLNVSYCEALTGGALFIDEQIQTTVTNSSFLHNKANVIGGVFYVSHSTVTQIQNSLFSHNQAQIAGVFYVTMAANLQLLNSEFSHNSGVQNSGVGLIFNNEAVRRPNFNRPKQTRSLGANLEITEPEMQHFISYLQLQWCKAVNSSIIMGKWKLVSFQSECPELLSQIQSLTIRKSVFILV